MTGFYRTKSGVVFTVILDKVKGKEVLKRGRYKDFVNRTFSLVTEEVLQQELLTGEIEKICNQ